MSADVTWTARTDDTVTESVTGSLLVYDTRTDEVHALDETATAVYRAATGRSVQEIAQACGLTEGTVADTLLKLSELGLVAEGTSGSRRAFLKVMATGAAVGIVTLAAPSPAAAASGETTPDTTTTEEPP